MSPTDKVAYGHFYFTADSIPALPRISFDDDAPTRYLAETAWWHIPSMEIRVYKDGAWCKVADIRLEARK